MCIYLLVAPPEIPTLKYFVPPTYFHTQELLHVRESGTKAVITAAMSLLGISSSIGMYVAHMFCTNPLSIRNNLLDDQMCDSIYSAILALSVNT